MKLEGDSCCTAHCILDVSYVTHEIPFSWRAQYLVNLAEQFLLDVSDVRRINHEIHFSWQAHYLVKLEEDS